ncbi:hypothetical protein F0562_021249 [Nyssa sinensis]|uniref:SMP domain-containing protein n=1 Tax=Nyssa sinensis TaxID=561372 RepID=A0A5J5BKT7_9ASTE|nr:hypothetical protein F0562_021249 [Nyssa sinensis]
MQLPLQAAENMILGQTQKGGPAAVMQSAAAVNERRGVVRHDDVTNIAKDQGVTIFETEVAGGHIVTEAVGGQVVGQYSDKPVDQSDAAAIQAAEVRATGRNQITPGGVAAVAQSAAKLNSRTMPDENKTKLADVLADATGKLAADKPPTRQDAEGVIGAELRNNPKLATHPGGVAASVAAAARLNQEK